MDWDWGSGMSFADRPGSFKTTDQVKTPGSTAALSISTRVYQCSDVARVLVLFLPRTVRRISAFRGAPAILAEQGDSGLEVGGRLLRNAVERVSAAEEPLGLA